jgi:hypothetical protein
MKTMVVNSTNNYSTPCVYVQSALLTDTESSIIAKAVTHNSDRVIVAYPLLKDYSDRILSP